MKRVWKYEIHIGSIAHIMHDHDAKVVLVSPLTGTGDRLNFWIEFEGDFGPSHHRPDRKFQVFGTGHPIPDCFAHRGSVVVGQFVWHLYEDMS